MQFPLMALVLVVGSSAWAQDTHLLQQRASFSYREMQQAERDAELAAIEAKDINAQVAELQKQLDALKKRAATAATRVNDSRLRAAESRKRWEAAAAALEKAEAVPRP